jgi:hypothetical protein
MFMFGEAVGDDEDDGERTRPMERLGSHRAMRVHTLEKADGAHG